MPFSVNVHVFVLFPPLEQAPDQITSRLFVALNVIEVPTLNDAEPLLPTDTLMPAGLDVTRSPPRPVAVTVSVAVPVPPPPVDAGFTVSVAERVTPAYTPEIVAAVEDVTDCDATVNVALVDPAGIVTLAATAAAFALLLDSATTAPPDGAAAVSLAVPTALPLPPMTLVGESDTLESDGAGGGADVVPSTRNDRTDDHAPAVPALLRARTRHQ